MNSNISFYLCKISYLIAAQYVWTAVILEKLLLVLVTKKVETGRNRGTIKGWNTIV